MSRVSLAVLATGMACAPGSHPGASELTPGTESGEQVRVLDLYPGVTATIVTPARREQDETIDLVLYALPNGNTTLETMGRRPGDSVGWRYDIQHIAAQARALRAAGMPRLAVAYLEADTKSWPEWRRRLGYQRANARIAGIVDQLRSALGNPTTVTLAAHSGGGSFIWGFLEDHDTIPGWVTRIAFLDANYSFVPRHGESLDAWLAQDTAHTLIIMAYDDREIVLDGRKVVSDSGGTWRATQRMLDWFRRSRVLSPDTLGEFLRWSDAQVRLLAHPNPQNRILHTVMVGEMNGFMHAMLVRRPGYESGPGFLIRQRAYDRWIGGGITLPVATPPDIPPRPRDAISGTAFIAAVADLPREEREAAILRELMRGNIPAFLRTMETVRDTVVGPDGASRELTFEVMPDYLAIGSDEDYVRMPMNPYTAQAFCEAHGFTLPTRKLVDDTWRAARVHAEPQPLTEAREAPTTFLHHHRLIDAQLGASRGGFVAGIKKDVVISNRLRERENRVAIYGWHYRNGQPIQPVYAGHVDWYVDYSHGIRPVRRTMRVNGVPMSFDRLVQDSTLASLVSDEGIIAVTRYERRQP